MHLPSTFDIALQAGRDLGRAEERERIAAIMASPEAQRFSGPAARLALETNIAAGDASRLLAEMSAPMMKRVRAR